MAPPIPTQNPVSPPVTSTALPANSADERRELLDGAVFVGDSRWKEFHFRQKHLKLFFAIDAVLGFMEGKVPEEKLQQRVQAWLDAGESAAEEDKTFYESVQKNIYAQLGKFQSPENTARAQKVQALLPKGAPPEPVPTVPPDPVPPPQPAAPAKPPKIQGDKYLNLGLELQNDTFLADTVMGNLGIPINTFMTEKSTFTLKAPVEFSVGPVVGMIRPYYGQFKSRGIPGNGFGEIGEGDRLGVDMGFVNPYSPKHESATIGVEVTGFKSGPDGVQMPDSVVRLHLARQNDLFTLGKNKPFQLGLQTFGNYQETYLVLGNDQPLLPNQPNNPLANSGNIFVKSPFRLLGVSARYYLNGAPEAQDYQALAHPFRPGEAVAKIGSVFVGDWINWNRRRDMTAFAQTRVFLGYSEALGPTASRQQFDAAGLGLSIFSLLDGTMIGSNARDRGEIWRRGSGFDIGVMAALDAFPMGISLLQWANAKADPPKGQTIADFTAHPGSVTDFQGRAGRMNVFLEGFELGLSGLYASGAMGHSYDDELTHYAIAHAAALAAGVPLYFLSAPISGSTCGPDGGLLRCGFGSTGRFFGPTPIDVGPQDIRQQETQYVVSTMGSAAMSTGASGLLNLLTVSKDRKTAETVGGKKGVEKVKGFQKNSSWIQNPNVNVQVSKTAFQLGLRGEF